MYRQPAIGKEPIKKLDVRILERFYTELHRCRVRCNAKPFIEKHRAHWRARVR